MRQEKQAHYRGKPAHCPPSIECINLTLITPLNVERKDDFETSGPVA
jgi:hypothetical protein